MKYRIEPRTPSFSENMQNGLEQSAKSAALMTGGLILGGVALGVGAVRSRRIRLKLMGAAHFPISFLIISTVLTYVTSWICDVGDPGGTEAFASTLPWIILAAAIISIIWSIFFIKRYVRPKLKELDDAEYATAAAAAASTQSGSGIIYPPGYMP